MTQTKKMKTFKNLCLTLGLMLSVVACSKEAKDAPQTLEPSTRSEEGKSIHVGSRDSIVVNFTIGADSEELRLAQSVNAEGIPFNPFMEEKDVVIRFAVRTWDRASSQLKITYTNARCKKIPGENKASYKGVIYLPDLGYDNYPPQSRPAYGPHQIAGVLLGEADGGTQFVEEIDANSVKTFEQTELLTAENDIVRSKVPYILDWTNFPLTTEGTQPSKLNLHFKAIGNLLRIQFNNELDEAKTLQSITVSSSVFVTQSKIDLTARKLTHEFNSYDHSVTTISGSSIGTPSPVNKTYRFTTPIQIGAKSKSKFYYLWVMPIHAKALFREGETEIKGKTKDGKDHRLVSLCDPLLEGTNKLTLSFKEPSTIATAFRGGKLPLWYVAEYNVAPGGKALMDTHNIIRDQYGRAQNHGLFTQEEAESINISGYYLPREYDFTVIAGYNPFGGLLNNIYFHESSLLKREVNLSELYNVNEIQHRGEPVQFPGEPELSRTSAQYLTKPGNVIYALRFKQCGNYDRLTAYRYRAIDVSMDGSRIPLSAQPRLEITSMFLGNGFTGDINTISNPTFWTSANPQNSVTRVFPIIYYFGGTTDGKAQFPSQGSTSMFEINQSDGFLGVAPDNISNGASIPVRLFRTDFTTAK